eukprot:scaffold11940_cov80-Skeletonema_marinoi.AAC.1
MGLEGEKAIIPSHLNLNLLQYCQQQLVVFIMSSLCNNAERVISPRNNQTYLTERHLGKEGEGGMLYAMTCLFESHVNKALKRSIT